MLQGRVGCWLVGQGPLFNTWLLHAHLIPHCLLLCTVVILLECCNAELVVGLWGRVPCSTLTYCMPTLPHIACCCPLCKGCGAGLVVGLWGRVPCSTLTYCMPTLPHIACCCPLCKGCGAGLVVGLWGRVPCSTLSYCMP